MNVQNISLNKIYIGKNSRMGIDKADLSGLMDSIKHEGLLEPIGVVKNGRGYQIAYGNRRFLAYSKLGRKSIPAVVLEKKSQVDVDMMNLAENIQRSNISVVEAGRYISHLQDEGLLNREIQVRLGVSKSYLDACLSAFRNVPKKFQNKISTTQGRGISKKDPGTITVSDIPKITAAIKSLHLSSNQASTLFEAATHDNFNSDKIRDYAKAAKAGKKDVLKEVGNFKSFALNIVVTEREYNRLFNKYISDGPFSSHTALLKAILKREVNEKVNVEA